MKARKITQERLKEFLRYDPGTGKLIWVKEKGTGTKIGAAAGTKNKKDYVVIVLDGKNYGAHRLAFLYMTGEWPKEEVDHINGDKHDKKMKHLGVFKNIEDAAQAYREAADKHHGEFANY